VVSAENLTQSLFFERAKENGGAKRMAKKTTENGKRTKERNLLQGKVLSSY